MPLLDLFWTILWISLWMLWIFLVISIFVDIFRSKDLGGWAKAAWVFFVILVPLIGVLVYLVVRGDSMHRRAADEARARDDAAAEYVRQAAAGVPTASDELAKLAKLRDDGVINDAEFQAQKAKVLA